MCARCRYCAVEKFRCALIVALRCADVVARAFAVRCAFALSGFLSLVCAPHAVSASARLPIQTEYRIGFIIPSLIFPFRYDLRQDRGTNYSTRLTISSFSLSALRLQQFNARLVRHLHSLITNNAPGNGRSSLARRSFMSAAHMCPLIADDLIFPAAPLFPVPHLAGNPASSRISTPSRAPSITIAFPLFATRDRACSII
jgi:hypothetical protein